jgi:outer membrane protein assembly factor BamB
VDEDSAYALTNKGILACVDARNGRLRWQKHLAQEYDALDPYYGFSTSPVIDGDLVILNANASGMAVDKRTGRLAWTSEKPPAQRLIAELGTDNGVTYMSPALFEQGDRRLALVSSWQGLFAVDVKTGQPAWRYPWQNYNINKTPDPVVVGSRVLLVDDSRIGRGARFSTLLDVSGHEPRVAWESEALYSDVCTPVVLDGYAYCEHGGCYPNSPTSSLRCIELATGRLAWEHFPQGRKSKEWISLVIADGKLIVLTASGRLQVAEASPQGWRPIAGCQLPKGNKRLMRYWTVPVLSHGRIYCRGYDGSLACIDVRP